MTYLLDNTGLQTIQVHTYQDTDQLQDRTRYPQDSDTCTRTPRRIDPVHTDLH